jgi:hypothetical protein
VRNLAETLITEPSSEALKSDVDTTPNLQSDRLKRDTKLARWPLLKPVHARVSARLSHPPGSQTVSRTTGRHEMYRRTDSWLPDDLKSMARNRAFVAGPAFIRPLPQSAPLGSEVTPSVTSKGVSLTLRRAIPTLNVSPITARQIPGISESSRTNSKLSAEAPLAAALPDAPRQAAGSEVSGVSLPPVVPVDGHQEAPEASSARLHPSPRGKFLPGKSGNRGAGSHPQAADLTFTGRGRRNPAIGQSMADGTNSPSESPMLRQEQRRGASRPGPAARIPVAMTLAQRNRLRAAKMMAHTGPRLSPPTSSPTPRARLSAANAPVSVAAAGQTPSSAAVWMPPRRGIPALTAAQHLARRSVPAPAEQIIPAGMPSAGGSPELQLTPLLSLDHAALPAAALRGGRTTPASSHGPAAAMELRRTAPVQAPAAQPAQAEAANAAPTPINAEQLQQALSKLPQLHTDQLADQVYKSLVKRMKFEQRLHGY